MHIFAAVLALLLLAIVLSPIVMRRFRLARRERAVHLGGSCHWYANYDEELRYEPQSGADIVRVLRDDVLRRGYAPTSEVQITPRTFRHRVPGDSKIRLWKNGDASLPALWLCEWAMDPVRVSIGVGDREKVPGVESGRIPIESELAPEPVRAVGSLDWNEDSIDPSSRGEETAPSGGEPPVLHPDPSARFEDEVTSPDDPPAEEVPAELASAGEPDDADVVGADSIPQSTGPSGPLDRPRSRRKRRR